MSNSSPSLQLSGNLTIRDAAALLEQLKAALAATSSLTIDCTALTGADLSVVQLLAAAHKTAAAQGKTLRLAMPAGGALSTLLVRAGLLRPDGTPKAPHSPFWAGALSSEAA